MQRCKWCGREYEYANGYSWDYCSDKCATEAKAAGR